MPRTSQGRLQLDTPPARRCTMSLFPALSARWQDHRPAIQTDREILTYGDLRMRIQKAAGWLDEQGLGPGQILALQMPRSLAFLELQLAALTRGVCTLPLNPDYRAHELRYMLEDASPSLAILLPARLAELQGDPGVPRLASSAEIPEALRAAAPALPIDGISEETAAVLLYTSGTTGRPKGALLKHRHIEATVTGLYQSWGFSIHDRLLHTLPLFHVHGLFVAQFQALMAGAFTRWLSRFEPERVLQVIAEEQMTVFMGVPTFYARLLQLPSAAAFDLSSMRLFTSGSAPLSARDHEAFERRFGHRILERYGMSEIGIVLSNPLHGERRPGTVGLPLPEVRAKVVDNQGRQLPDGRVGQLLIAGPSVFDGYLNRPHQSAEALRGGWMHTGDLAAKSDDGYLRIVGRMGEMILSGGMNVYPLEVESVLRDHPAVLDAAVFGLEDADLGERVVAAVVPSAEVDLDELRPWLRERLAGYKCPKEYHAVSDFPRNALGKVQKHRLRATWSGAEP
ncbi:MAG: malonyl-CoA synthase [Deltaproteobacteria bacterium]|nr:MAG: malonyl-CoA synthase [Deltaproteobacteria bacterium]